MSDRTAIEILLTARRVAIVGASDDGLKASGRTQRYLKMYGFPGEVYPVNPRRESVQGTRAYPSLSDVPQTPDVAVVVLPQALVEDAVRDCGRAGVPLAIVFASGYAELGEEGVDRQQSLTRVAREAGVRIIGPNGNGAVFAPSRLTAGFMTGLDQTRWELRDDGIAFISQSGAMGAFILNMAQTEGLGVGRFVSTGNEIDLSLPMLIEQLVDEGSTRAVMGYVEGIRDGNRLVAALHKASERGVPVTLMKVGRTEQGAAAAASHTGSLAGSDDVYAGLFRRYGVQRAESIEDLLDFGRVLAGVRHPRGRRVTIVTLSGGAGALMTDYASDLGLEMASWTGEWRERMAAALPPFASVGNPIDVTGAIASDDRVLTESVSIALQHPGTDALLVLLGNMEAEEERVCASLVRLAEQSDKPLLVTWVGGSGQALKTLNAAGIPCFADPRRTMRALAAQVAFAARPALAEPVEVGADPTDLADHLLGRGATGLDEVAAKALLAAAGVPTVMEAAAGTAGDAARAAAELGFPVALKLLSVDVAHKSELGVVRLGLQTAEEVLRQAEDIVRIADQAGVADRRLVVQRMVAPEVELILGSVLDPVFGPVTMLGLGGVFAEVLADVQVRPSPVGMTEAREMIGGLRGVALLRGARGRKPADEEALARVVVDFSRLSADLGDRVESIEVNPLVIDSNGLPVAVDGLVLLPAGPTEEAS
jgi:acyl-CoA synthetase (NDP forming)